MRSRFYQLIGTMIVGVILLFSSVAATAQTNVIPDNVELAALKAMYDSLGGANWTTKTNWPTAATWPASATAAQMGTWYGITVVNGDISKITFSQKNLIGKIPSKLGDLKALTVLDLNTHSGITGSLPASLWTITTLQEVRLYSCNLSGTIAPEIFNLPNLKILNLNINKFTGSLPTNMGNATALTTLGISYSPNLAGTLPTSIGSLINLTTLQIEGTQIAGTIPTTIGNLINLTYLKLNSNKLTGSIPVEIGNLTNLTTGLYLNNNLLTGSIPSSIGNLTLLKALDFSTNQLSGTIPTTIGNLTQLTSLVLAINQLSGSIPTSIGNLTKLTTLGLQQNNLTGVIPDSIGNLINLTQIALNTNQLNGSIPSTIGNLTKLTSLGLNYNQLSGSIPASIGNLTSLVGLALNNNSLTGSIPSTIGNLVNLSSLNLSANQLSGSIPVEIGNMTKLTGIMIAGNQLTGSIPSSIGNLINLTYFYAYTNQLSGSIPVEIGNLTKLTSIQLYSNQLTGPIPSSIGNLVNMYSLLLNYNQLSGNIPSQIGNLSNLNTLYLHNNFLSGPIPSSLGNLTKLAYVNFNNNQLSGEIPASLSAWSQVVSMSLGNNQLSGEVPANLFTNWTKVTYIMISGNFLKGALPNSIINCALLSAIYINNNQFTALPPSFLSLSKLTLVYLNDNELKAIPNFSTYSNKANLALFVQNNRLDFSNLEWLGSSSGIAGRTVTPLKNINDFVSAGYKAGNPLVIQARPPGLNSTITWEKQNTNGTWAVVNSLNQDATQKTFTRNVPSISDHGYYRWRMTNTVIGGYTLFSEPIYVSDLSSLDQSKTLYNGLITAASWRTDKAYGVNGEDLTGMYLYDYDEKYQLKEAVFATPNFTAGTYKLAGNSYRVGGMEYDPNGNIQKLKRYKGNGQIQHDFGYTYIPNTNQLTSVSSYAGYEYNKIGQTTKVDKVANDGKDQYIEYDVTGKVVAVFEDVNKTKVTTRYTYDDRGFRLTKADYDSKGALIKTYWYIRDASGNVLSIYEQAGADSEVFTDFKQTEVPIYGAGKIGTYYTKTSIAADQAQIEKGSTAYEITDHLGNVRAVVRVQPNEYTATMEDDGTTAYTNPRVYENVYFKNLFETEKRDAQMNHTSTSVTANPNTSSYLYWINGQAGITPDKKSVGPATALMVNPGDKLDVSAWARYKIKTSYTKASLLPVLASVLGGDFVYNGGLESMTQTVSAFTTGIPLMLQAPGNGSDRPHAYINYLIFPSDNSAPYGRATQIPASAGFEEPQRNAPFTANNLVKVDPITITKPGYIYIWVSNETENTEVWFDDVSVQHYKGVVTQATDYGAWGEVMREQRLDLASGELTAPLLKDNIQANYKLDGNALDAGPNAMNGTVTGATPTTDKNNLAGKAYSFNGTSRIDLPGSAQKLSFIQNTGVFTLSVFMKVNDVGPNAIYYPMGNMFTTTMKGFWLSFGAISAGVPRQVGFNIARGVSGVSVYAKSSANSINDTDWHHIAVVGDGTTVKIYVDGVQSGAAVTFVGTLGDSSFDVLLGGTRANTGAFTNGFTGGLDGLLVFDRTLTDEEVAALATGKPTEDIDAETLSQKYRYGYQGKYAERDEETGWNHFELREYDPVIGRWTSPDPAGQHWGPYIAMSNNPVNNVDPDGGWDNTSGGLGRFLLNTFQPVLNALGKGFKDFGNKVLDGTQFVLDIAGMVPVLGAIPDIINAGISALRGNWGEAGVNLISAIPLYGDIVGGTKIGAKVVTGAAVVASAVKKKISKSFAHKVASKAAKKYSKLFQCVECSETVIAALKKEGLQGELITLKAPNNRNIWSDVLNKNISENGVHHGVLVDGKIFDNLNPNGIDYDTWIKAFASPEGFNIIKKSF